MLNRSQYTMLASFAIDFAREQGYSDEFIKIAADTFDFTAIQMYDGGGKVVEDTVDEIADAISSPEYGAGPVSDEIIARLEQWELRDAPVTERDYDEMYVLTETLQAALHTVMQGVVSLKLADARARAADATVEVESIIDIEPATRVERSIARTCDECFDNDDLVEAVVQTLFQFGMLSVEGLARTMGMNNQEEKFNLWDAVHRAWDQGLIYDCGGGAFWLTPDMYEILREAADNE